jgi:hypothetical protein
MRRFRSLTPRFAAGALTLAVVALCSGSAKADITIFDQDGWSFRINGLVAAHYQLVQGDPDPEFANAVNSVPAAGGQILDEKTASNVSTIPPTLTLSNVRSGFIGTQIGFGVTRRITPTVRVESQLAISVAGINSNRGQDLAFAKEGDYREAWAAIISPYGTLRFGRMFGIFGEGSAEVMLMAYRYGVGHPCVINHSTISCGSSGAGPIYAGFDGAIRYITPRLAGFEFAVSVVDPAVGPGMKMSPVPRVDAEANFDNTIGPAHLRIIAQSMFDRIENSTMPSGAGTPNFMPGTVKVNNVWGAMGTGILSLGGLTLGGGGWTGKGVGERIPMEAADPANPISYDSAFELRQFLGYYGNAQFTFADNTITAGGGILYVKPTALDNTDTAPADVLDNQSEFHVVFNHKFDTIVVTAEYMRWQTKWHFGEIQHLNFAGAGINYFW